MRVLAFGVGSPAGALCCTVLAGRLGTPFVYLTLAGSVLQIVGAFLLSSVPATVNAWPGEYGYMAVTGLGTGISIAALYMAVPMVVGHRDQGQSDKLWDSALMLDTPRPTWTDIYSRCNGLDPPGPHAGCLARHCHCK